MEETPLPTATTPANLQRWQCLLLQPHHASAELYDEDNGIKQNILTDFGFHPEYLSYSSTTSTRSVDRLKAAGHNWRSVSHVSRGLRGVDNVKLLMWNFSYFKNQLRRAKSSTPASLRRAYQTHARGIFVDRAARLLIIYEPRIYQQQINPHFGRCVDDFVKQFKSFTRFVVYGNQKKTQDCEKRVLRFGACCWEKIRASGSLQQCRTCHCGLEITYVTTYSIRKV